MTVSKALIEQAAYSLSEIKNFYMDPKSLVEDLVILSWSFQDENDYMSACSNTRRVIAGLLSGTLTSSNLKYDFDDWKSYHYQHRVGQGLKANCRIIFRPCKDGIEVMGFGHRRIPSDIYMRMSEQRL